MSVEIEIDKSWWDCTAIDTESFLAATLGDELELPEDMETGAWLYEVECALLDHIENMEGQRYSRTDIGNTYNHEQDLGSEFQWMVFYPEGEGDHFWCQDAYVAVEVHRGGDVRGNYGRVRLYKVDCLGETGFHDQSVGWSAEPLDDFQEYCKTEVQHKFDFWSWHQSDFFDDTRNQGLVERLNERCTPGYSSSPSSELRDHIDGDLEWSEALGCFVGKLPGGALVKVHPYSYAGGE